MSHLINILLHETCQKHVSLNVFLVFLDSAPSLFVVEI